MNAVVESATPLRETKVFIIPKLGIKILLTEGNFMSI